MHEPVRKAYSLEEIMEEAKRFMVENYGKAQEAEDRDRWHERYGMLISFLQDLFPRGY